MMAGVTGKVIALVYAALVASPVSRQHLACWHQARRSSSAKKIGTCSDLDTLMKWIKRAATTSTAGEQLWHLSLP